MTLDLLHRIRWANVARAAAVALALLLALAWPRLRAHPDAQPPAIEPVSAAPARPAAAAKATRVAPLARVKEAETPREKISADRVRPRVPNRREVKRRAARHHRHARQRRPRIATPAATPAPASVAPSAGVVPAAEFRP